MHGKLCPLDFENMQIGMIRSVFFAIRPGNNRYSVTFLCQMRGKVVYSATHTTPTRGIFGGNHDNVHNDPIFSLYGYCLN